MWVILQSYVPKVWPHSLCYASTTAMLSSLICLLPLSIAFFTYRTVLLASYWKFLKLTTCVSVSSLAPNPTQIQYNINALCNTLHTLLHLKLPSILYTFHALALILSASRFLGPDFPLLVPHTFSVFGPSSWNDLPLPLNRNPLLTPLNQTSRHFSSQNCRPILWHLPPKSKMVDFPPHFASAVSEQNQWAIKMD